MEDKILKKKIKNYYKIIFLIFFFFPLGQKAILVALNSEGLLSMSSVFSSTIRIVVIGLLFTLASFKKNIEIKNIVIVFIIFFSILFFSILFDLNVRSFKTYYLSGTTVVLYMFANVFLIFFGVIYLRLNQNQLNKAKVAVFFSGFLFSLLSIYSYGKYFGNVARLTSTSAEESLISPLILSYGAALTIGVVFFELSLKNNTIKKILYLIVILMVSFIPFLLGASRGSVIALVFPIFFIFLFRKGVASKIKTLIFLIVLVVTTAYLSGEYGSNIIDRFMSKGGSGISIDVDSRTFRWAQAMEQFMDHPFLGDSIVLEGYVNYPHNIIIEVLQITGLIGFFPFIFLLYKGLSASVFIIRELPQNIWIVVFFLQSLMQNMFSGSIITATWFWFSLALVTSIKIWSLKLNSIKLNL
jgi:O-antigen ligase